MVVNYCASVEFALKSHEDMMKDDVEQAGGRWRGRARFDLWKWNSISSNGR